jgi:hypothetical protein
MARGKNPTAEQIVNLLRQVEVELAQAELGNIVDIVALA